MWSVVELYLVIVTVLLVVGGGIVVWCPMGSTMLTDMVKYGKSSSKERSLFISRLSVPKRWFSHFYVIAAVSSIVWLIIALLPSSRGDPRLVAWLRHISSSPPRVSMGAGLLCLSMVVIHCLRRLWETFFVSIYSDTEMNFFHYIVGVIHYLLLPPIVVSEMRGIMSRDHTGDTGLFSVFNGLSMTQWGSLFFFLFCSFFQYRCALKLASMRRNHLGNITHYGHGIPFGGWFEWVSCPHFFFEICIYLSFYCSLEATHRVFLLLFIFVMVNQIVAALITHQWYLDRFKGTYPSQRKAIFPCLL